jgi:hypothetical protein
VLESYEVPVDSSIMIETGGGMFIEFMKLTLGKIG